MATVTMVVSEEQGPQTTSTESHQLHEQIAALAYTLWQERGCPAGSPEDDWFQAEKVLSGKHES